MLQFFVSKIKEADGSHEVHSARCVFLPRAKSDCFPVGRFERCADAVDAAKDQYPTAVACFFCGYDCHVKDLEIRNKYYASDKSPKL